MENIIEYPTGADRYVGKEFVVGATTKVWDGEKWVNKSFGNHELRLQDLENEVASADLSNVSSLDSLCRAGGGVHAGNFLEGFTINSALDFGSDVEKNLWKYEGEVFPFEVPAEFDPSTSDDFSIIHFAQKDYVQEYVDNKFELKFFISPTTTEYRQVQVLVPLKGSAYQVRQFSDDSLVSVFEDKEGTIEIPQAGVSNVSSLNGDITFYVKPGRYYLTMVDLRADFIVEYVVEPVDLVDDPQNWLQRDFGAVPLTNAADIATSDATNEIEAALQSGGALHIEAGVYVIKRPIVARGITTIVGQSAGAGTGGFDPDSDPDTFLSALIKEADEGAAIFYVAKEGWSNVTMETAAITFREDRFRNMPSIYLENFKIVSDINEPAPIGLIKIEGAYDNNSMLNVNAMFCGDDYHAIEVTKGAFEGTLGQSVNWTGVNAIGATGGNRTASTIKIDWLQEGTFNSCKAFGSPYRVDVEGNPLYSANPAWEIDNSRGLVWVGSSGALTLGSGFLFKATERSCQYHLMDGCTYELVGKRVDELLIADASIYTDGDGVLETPQATSFTAGQIVKFGALATQEYKILAIGSNELFVQPAMGITSFVDDVYEVKPTGSAIELHKTTISGLSNITVSAPRVEAPVEHFLWAHSDNGKITNIKAQTLFGKVTLDETSLVEIDSYSKYSIQHFNSLGVNIETPANASVSDKSVQSLIIDEVSTPQIKYSVNPNNPSEFYRTAWSASVFDDFGYLWQNTKSGYHMLHNTDGSLIINDGVDAENTVNSIRLSPSEGVQVRRTVSPTYRFLAGDSYELEAKITYSASTSAGELALFFAMDSGSSVVISPSGSIALNNLTGDGAGTSIDLQAPNNLRKVLSISNTNEIEVNGTPIITGGATGSFMSADNKAIVVTDGKITSIV